MFGLVKLFVPSASFSQVQAGNPKFALETQPFKSFNGGFKDSNCFWVVGSSQQSAVS